MLLTSVVIVLREFLEAALIISVLLAVSDELSIPRRWVRWGIGIGLAGALAYAANTAAVSDWLDGVGQEVVNAMLQIAVYCCLILVALLFSRRRPPEGSLGANLAILMTVAVGLAVAREGSEIMIYLSGFAGDRTLLQPVVLGGMVGAGIGTSVGALTYYLLINIGSQWSMRVIIALIALIAAGLLSQATALLIQADWLPAQLPLWNTSGWLPESSIVGQLLYAVIGYEATPTPIQTLIHVGGLLLPLALVLLQRPDTTSHD
ncbi:MAG: FTR1 family protein [Gammaproteobacteria bacterium]